MQEIDYNTMTSVVESFAREEPFWGALFSNTAAVIMQEMQDVSWAGFYLVRKNELVLGPFQGKVACIHIQKGKGVCGTSWEQNRVQLVPDVHQFPGHIACDSASRSEIVIPIHRDGQVAAVLDLDSTSLNRFSESDAEGLTQVVRILEGLTDWSGLETE